MNPNIVYPAVFLGTLIWAIVMINIWYNRERNSLPPHLRDKFDEESKNNLRDS